MQRKNLLSIILIFILSVQISFAQVTLPQPSPAGSVMQVVGLTEIKVDFSSPAIKGRKVWGDLVPYGQMWRTGANRPTKITFSEEVMIGDKKIAKGSYTLITIPNENEWTIILNTDSKGNGAFSYLETDDVVCVNVKPEKTTNALERLTFMVTSTDNISGNVSLLWENLKVTFKVTTDPVTASKKNIEKGLAGNWYEYAISAEFYMNNNMDKEVALKYADLSISLQDHFFNKWVKAQLLAAKGDKAGALQFAKEAQKFGDANPSGFYDANKAQITAKITEWSK